MKNASLIAAWLCFFLLSTGCESRLRSERNSSATADAGSGVNRAVRRDLLDRASEYQRTGQFVKATEILRSALVSDSRDYEAMFMLANAKAAQGEVDEAIELLAEIPEDHPEAGIPSLVMAADWCMERQRFDEAEERYQKLLQIDPTLNAARRKLAFLFNRQGRRHEAVLLIRELCLAGDITQDELHALIIEADAMHDAPGTPIEPGVPLYLPIGVMGEARLKFSQREYGEVVTALEPLVASNTAPPAVIALFGFATVEAQDDVRFERWIKTQANDQVKRFPEYWAAVGTRMLSEAKFNLAIGALAEAIRLDPTDLRSTRRMIQAFRSLNDEAMVEKWMTRYATLTSTLKASLEVARTSPPSMLAIADLTKSLQGLDRQLEAILWQSIGIVHRGGNQTEMANLNTQMNQTIRLGKAFASSESVLCGLNLQRFPKATLDKISIASQPSTTNRVDSLLPDAAAFENISTEVGLNQRYKIALEKQEQAFAIYQQYGGGVAVFDYDQDGQVDLFFAQGAAESPDFVASESDQLYRTITEAGQRKVRAVTVPADIDELRFSLGVTSGDWNQDGFPDLVVTNIGANALLINCGDGTFKEQLLDENASLTKMSSSVAMGDLTGDHLPDLLVLNYVEDATLGVKPKLNDDGYVENARTPFNYQPARDNLYTNDSSGGWKKSQLGDSDRDASYGLGVVLTDLTSANGNEIFVANDGKANQLWCRSESLKERVDQASILGCAFSSFGSPTASMGVAAGDLDRSDSLDLYVTTFYEEASCLFLNEGNMFRDRNVKYKLNDASWSALGFGSQAIDYSNNGWLDLAVANGHVDNLAWKKQPFRQPMQLFANLSTHFALVTVDDESGFWEQGHLGRGLAKLDFDRNGKMDLIVTDLLEPAALLINRSPSTNNWLALRLVGTASERDAIGAKVHVEAGDQSWTQWVTAGDGYLCKNDPVLIFGLGQQASVKKVTVSWPNQVSQEFTGVPINQVSNLTENEISAFQCD